MMTTIDVRNVHDALPEGCHQLRRRGVEQDSRNGKVMVFPGPLATTYRRPQERVLFFEERDANPFFHLFESLWMLAGRDDVAYVQRYSSKIGDYSDDGVRFNAAYGFRWRHNFGRDQLEAIVHALRNNRLCRRQVLSMWDGHNDLGAQTKDAPCNTHAYFQVGRGDQLDMMVCNRSNDMVWGAYGANAVHFSVLQEYMAQRIGVGMGEYTQVSMNTHVYERHWELMKQMADMASDGFELAINPYDRGCLGGGAVVPHRLVDTNIDAWHADLERFLAGDLDYLLDPFFRDVCRPMELAWRAFKSKSLGDARIPKALACLGLMPEQNDWKVACTEWLQRRAK